MAVITNVDTFFFVCSVSRDPSIWNTSCSKHFDECGRGKFTIFPFYKMKNHDENFCRAKEDYFIELIKPSLNRVFAHFSQYRQQASKMNNAPGSAAQRHAQ